MFPVLFFLLLFSSSALALNTTFPFPANQLLFDELTPEFFCHEKSVDDSCNALAISRTDNLFIDKENLRISEQSRDIYLQGAIEKWRLKANYQRHDPSNNLFHYSADVAGFDFQSMQFFKYTPPNETRIQYDGLNDTSLALKTYFDDNLDYVVDGKIDLHLHPLINLAYSIENPRVTYTLQMNQLINNASGDFYDNDYYRFIEFYSRLGKVSSFHLKKSIDSTRRFNVTFHLSVNERLDIALSSSNEETGYYSAFTSNNVKQGEMSSHFKEQSNNLDIVYHPNDNFVLSYTVKEGNWNASAGGELNDTFLQSIFDPFELTRRNYDISASAQWIEHTLGIRFHRALASSLQLGVLTLQPQGYVESWIPSPSFFFFNSSDENDEDRQRSSISAKEILLASARLELQFQFHSLLLFGQYQQYIPLWIQYHDDSTANVFNQLDKNGSGLGWDDIFPLQGSMVRMGLGYEF